MPDYSFYYDLEAKLQQDEQLIPAPELYSFDDEKIYAAILNRLAQPLPTGEESPFSAQVPGSAHSLLVSNLVYLQSLIAHEFNLVPDAMMLEWLRLLGSQLRAAEYPILSVRFTRSADSINRNIPCYIPLGLEIRSISNSSLSVFTITDGRIEGSDSSIVIPCRLNQIGKLPTIRQGEFSQIPHSISFIDTAANEGIITPGRPAETLPEAAIRTRDWLRTGDRCITDRDFAYYAIKAGAEKVNVIRGKAPGVEGTFRDLRSIAVYPAIKKALVEAEIKPRRMADERLRVVAAEVIPIAGLIQVKAMSNLSQFEVFNLVANAIAENINPPNGKWGDLELEKSIAEALERVQGIYAVPTVQLIHATSGVALNQLEKQPWQLFEVQQTITIEVLR